MEPSGPVIRGWTVGGRRRIFRNLLEETKGICRGKKHMHALSHRIARRSKSAPFSVPFCGDGSEILNKCLGITGCVLIYHLAIGLLHCGVRVGNAGGKPPATL